MLDWSGSEDMESDGMEYHHQPTGQMFSGGLDIPSDNDVSCMVEEYLTKDVTTLIEEDWASVVDEAAHDELFSIYMMNNPDHHVSMSGPMNSSPSVELNFNGMYSEISQQANSLSNSMAHHQMGHHNHHSHQQQQQQQHQLSPPQQRQLNNFEWVPEYQQTDLIRHGNGNMQYLNQQFNQAQVSPPQHHGDQYSLSQPGNQMASYYDNQTSQAQEHFSQTSPVYYVARTVDKIPAPDNTQTSFNFAEFASLPNLSTNSGLHHARLQPHVSRSHGSSSSAGNSPSSQSPVSEEDFHDPIPVNVSIVKQKTAAKKKSENVPAVKKPKLPAKVRRRKKDPNEPTKPVSAYALFFRDKQANIKGSKPDATFGEVSKIVAHMWDILDSDKKGMYKKRTEEAKKDYLQQLAVYRASLLSSPDSAMYIQTNFVSRSSPMQMTNYNRPVYSNIQNQNNPVMQHSNNTSNNGHAIKTHLQTFPAQNGHMPTRSPTQEDSCLHQQISHVLAANEGQIKIENAYGQVYARVVEPDGGGGMKNGYITQQMSNLCDAQVLWDSDGSMVAHCKEDYPSWMTNQRSVNPNSTKVII